MHGDLQSGCRRGQETRAERRIGFELSGVASIRAGTASPRLLVAGLLIIELRRNFRNGHLAYEGESATPDVTETAASSCGG